MTENTVMENAVTDLQTKLIEVSKATAKLIPCTEPQALIVIGTYMTDRGKVPTAGEATAYVISLKEKPIESFSTSELTMFLELGYIRRKQLPFKSLTNKVGRNEPCPCESGKKYKQCCLESVKAQDVERFISQGGNRT